MIKQEGLIEELDMKVISATKDRVEMEMPITDRVKQPFGFLHGGATIALLETAASFASELNTDLEKERPFGIDVHVRHRKSGKQGMLKGVAELGEVDGNKLTWNVAAYDDEGDVVSEGTVTAKIVTLERLAEKERQRASASTCK